MPAEDRRLPLKTRVFLALSSLCVSLLGAWILSLSLYGAFEASDYARVLSLEVLAKSAEERFEVATVIVSKTVLLLAPGFTLAALVRGFSARSAGLIRLVALGLVLWFLLLDRSLFQSVGRHLSDLWAFRHVPHGAEAAGPAGTWAWSAAKTGIVAAVVTVTFYGFVTVLERHVFPWVKQAKGGTSQGLLTVASLLFCSVLLVLAVLPHTRTLYLDPGLRERLYGALPLDVRLGRTEVAFQATTGPEQRLTRQLTEIYREHFSTLRNGRKPHAPEIAAKERPPIVFIVVESLRRDALTPELMPRLSHWAETAHTFMGHEAGTYSSEAGMFSLLYGRSNLSFHETLDARVPPLLFTWLRSLSYEISYFTGHPIEWLRREEFLSKDSVDRLMHSDVGSWPDWDRRALGALSEHVVSRKEPTFALAFLMSTHFEYQYPPEYEKHLPVARSKFRVTDVNAMNESDRVPHLNRYKNSLAFLDDLIAETVLKLPKNALVVVTGDHGESFYEGGIYGHGFAFSDAVLQVPLIVRFPEGSAPPFNAPEIVKTRTQHRDVIGWIARFLHGKTLFLDGFQGRQDFETEPLAALSAYADPGRRRTYCLLTVRTSDSSYLRLRLTLRNDEPRLSVLGFEGPFATPVAAPELNEKTIHLLTRAFKEELTRATH